MTAKAWIGLAMSQPDGLEGIARVLLLMLHYGWRAEEPR